MKKLLTIGKQSAIFSDTREQNARGPQKEPETDAEKILKKDKKVLDKGFELW